MLSFRYYTHFLSVGSFQSFMQCVLGIKCQAWLNFRFSGTLFVVDVKSQIENPHYRSLTRWYRYFNNPFCYNFAFARTFDTFESDEDTAALAMPTCLSYNKWTCWQYKAQLKVVTSHCMLTGDAVKNHNSYKIQSSNCWCKIHPLLSREKYTTDRPVCILVLAL